MNKVLELELELELECNVKELEETLMYKTLDNLITITLNNIFQAYSRHSIKSINKYEFLQQFCFLTLKGPRQTGHSLAMLKYISNNPHMNYIIIYENERIREHICTNFYDYDIDTKNVIFFSKHDIISNKCRGKQYPIINCVFIENFSYIDNGERYFSDQICEFLYNIVFSSYKANIFSSNYYRNRIKKQGIR